MLSLGILIVIWILGALLSIFIYSLRSHIDYDDVDQMQVLGALSIFWPFTLIFVILGGIAHLVAKAATKLKYSVKGKKL